VAAPECSSVSPSRKSAPKPPRDGRGGEREGAGRPRKEDGATEPYNFRATKTQVSAWETAAELSGDKKSVWSRDALDVWVKLTQLAHDEGINPEQLLATALELREHVPTLVAALKRIPNPTPDERRVLTLLTSGS
jgi:hypothetical protein